MMQPARELNAFPVPPRRRLRTGALELTAGTTKCSIQPPLLDRVRRVAVYDVYLGNDAASRVTARFFGTATSGTHEYGLLEVAGNSTAHARFCVPYDRKNRCRHLYLSLAGDDVALFAEAALPHVRGGGGKAAVAGGIACASGLLMLVLGAVVAQFGTSVSASPRVPVATLAAPVPALREPQLAAQIVSLAATREQRGGEASVLVSYGAVAQSGSIRVRTTAGSLVGQAPFSRAGLSRVVLHGHPLGSLRVEVLVDRGGSHAFASVDVPPEIAPTKPTAIASAPMPNVGEPFIIPARAIAGSALDIVFPAGLRDIHLTLQDAAGVTIDERSPLAAATHASFLVPDSARPQSVYVLCTYTQDAMEKTLVRLVRVVPR